MHAKDTLEEVVQEAIEKRMRVLALTEHMPRDQPEDLYPEEVVTAPLLHSFILMATYPRILSSPEFCGVRGIN